MAEHSPGEEMEMFAILCSSMQENNISGKHTTRRKVGVTRTSYQTVNFEVLLLCESCVCGLCRSSTAVRYLCSQDNCDCPKNISNGLFSESTLQVIGFVYNIPRALPVVRISLYSEWPGLLGKLIVVREFGVLVGYFLEIFHGEIYWASLFAVGKRGYFDFDFDSGSKLEHSVAWFVNLFWLSKDNFDYLVFSRLCLLLVSGSFFNVSGSITTYPPGSVTLCTFYYYAWSGLLASGSVVCVI